MFASLDIWTPHPHPDRLTLPGDLIWLGEHFKRMETKTSVFLFGLENLIKKQLCNKFHISSCEVYSHKIGGPRIMQSIKYQIS